MYKVLIAEDEMLVRIGLKTAIDWAKYEMTVIADVSNGQEAWDTYKQEAPDIVITDIKMPVMDGMELIARIRGLERPAKIIILTCLEDFELVRKALAHQVSDYILKLEMTTEQIEGLLHKLQTELNDSRRTAAEPLGIEQGAAKENLFKDYLFRNRYSDQEFFTLAERMHLRLKPSRLIVCAMEIDQYANVRNRFQDQKGELTRMSLLNVLDEVLSVYARGEVFHDEESRYIIMASFHDTPSEQQTWGTLHKMLQHIRSVMEIYFNATVSFGISGRGSSGGKNALKQQYRLSVQALARKFFTGNGTDIRADEDMPQQLAPALREQLLLLPEKWQVSGHYKSKLAGKISLFLQAEILPTKEDMQKQFLQWLLWPLTAMHLTDVNVPEIFTAYAEQIAKADTLQQSIAIYEQYLTELANFHAARKAVSREINEVLQYIETHYDRDLSLPELAGHVQMSPNYISSLFKKEMQQNYADYLVQYRIEKAKELLLGTYMKTYEVAEKIGFANQSYFSRAFKRFTGMSPREFRRQWVADWPKDGEQDEAKNDKQA